MTPRPSVHRTADALYREVLPVALWRTERERNHDSSHGWPLLLLVAALTSPYREIFDLAAQGEDGTPGWARVYDPDLAPDWLLPWMAQNIGVRLRRGSSAVEQRQAIKDKIGLGRGTTRTIVSEAQKTLTGNKTVAVVERDGGAYRLSVITRTAETPDPTATEDAIRAVKPAGLFLAYTVAPGQVWDEAVGTWDAAGAITWDETMNTNV